MKLAQCSSLELINCKVPPLGMGPPMGGCTAELPMTLFIQLKLRESKIFKCYRKAIKFSRITNRGNGKVLWVKSTLNKRAKHPLLTNFHAPNLSIYMLQNAASPPNRFRPLISGTKARLFFNTPMINHSI